MALLERERIRLQAGFDAAVAQVDSQQQAAAATQARLSAAQAQVVAAQSRLPALEAAAAAADNQVADLDAQIEAHRAREPEPTIEGDDGQRPRPNPEWRVWKRRLDQLVARQNQARASAAASHGALGNGQRTVAQAQLEVQFAEQQANETMLALQLAQVTLKVAQQQVADLERWISEIARDPLVRSALEQIADELSARTMTLQESLTLARFQQEDAESSLASLLARRDRLTVAVADLSGRIPAAQTELQEAQVEVDGASNELFSFLDAAQ